MRPGDIIKAKLLFVDDDKSFLDFLSTTFLEFSRNQWELKCVTDAAQALVHLRSQEIDLAVLDLQMPGVDGMQLLRMLKREFPALQIAFLTGQGDEQSRRSGLEEGAALFLEKPASAAGMESLFATINELARWQQRWGERGVVRRAGLLDLVKMECKSANSRLFEVFNAEERGQIWIKQGTIIHALAPEKRGQSAFTHLICLPNAEFRLKPFEEPIERSVDRDWEFLVLEAARVLEQFVKAPEAPVTEPPATPTPAATPVTPTTPPSALVPAPPVPSLPPVPARTDAPTEAPLSPAPQLRMASPVADKTTPPKLPSREAPKPPPVPAPRPAAPPSQPATPQPTAEAEVVFPPVAAAPGTRPLAVESDPARFEVEEIFSCSDRREVLYEWQCNETQKRLALIDFVTNKSRQLGQGLPLGKFDRIEMQANGGRWVVHLQQHRFIFIRSNTRIRQPAAPDAHGFKTVLEWLSQQTPQRGLLASGVALVDRRILTQSYIPDVPLSALNTAWPCLSDAYDMVARMQFSPWQMRWIYERAQIYTVRRGDGAILGLMLDKNASAIDFPAIEQLFNEFQTLREG